MFLKKTHETEQKGGPLPRRLPVTFAHTYVGRGLYFPDSLGVSVSFNNLLRRRLQDFF
jgi:hypothetical protein